MTDVKKPRKRRLASDEAHAWARNLRLGNHHAKSVLLDLTLYTDGDGRCFVSIEQIADDIEVARNTVRRRLIWLEHVGVLVRFPQWLDENGKRNGDARGKRTTDEVRLLIEADTDEIEARAAGMSGGHEEVDDEGEPEISPPPQGGLEESVSPPPQAGLNPVSPPLALQQPSHYGDGLISEPEPEDSPPTPPSGGARDVDDGWKEFCRAWTEPMSRPSLARQVWGALRPPERAIAPRAATGYFAWLRVQRKPPTPVSAQTFLREVEAFARWAAHAPPERTARAEPVFVPEGSPAWQAWLVIARISEGTLPRPTGIGDERGAKFSRSLSIAELALVRFGDRDASQWPIAKAGTQSCGAWCKFLGIKPRRIQVGTRRYEYLPGKWSDDWPINEEGLRVPCEWPPRKDGSLSTAPPEIPQCTGDDLDAFAKTG